MALDIKKILSLSGGIAAAVSTGGLSAAIIPGLGLAAALVPGKDDKKDALDQWERDMIVGWVAMYKRFMDIPMMPAVKRDTTMGKLRSDFIMRYADVPKERWVEHVHAMLVMAVHGELAASATP